jgi:hypothetical protein
MSGAALQIRNYSFPTGTRGRATIICGIVMLLASRREVLAPGSPIYDYLLAGRPDALKYAIWAQTVLFYLLVPVHALEVPFFVVLRLQPHGVPVFSAAGLKWLASIFVGGKFVWEHFDGLVKASQKTA